MRMLRSPVALVPFALALAVSCVACGSGPSVATVSKQFLSIEKNTNSALAKDTKLSAISERNAAYAVAFSQAAAHVRALQFPSYLSGDVNTLVHDLDVMARQATEVALDGAKNQNVQSNVVAYAHADLMLMDDEAAEKKASNALRRRVGLPIETTTTTPPNAQSNTLSPSP